MGIPAEVDVPVPPSTARTAHPSRRTVLRSAALVTAAAAAATIPVRGFDPEVAAAPARNGIFGYGVASGDPMADRVIIWTRATPPGRPLATPGSGHGAPLDVTWEVAADAHFRRIVRHGVVRTRASSDHTVKVDVTGLSTYTRYWFRFRAAGQTSAVGRTRTAPDEAGRTHALRFALVSCSNYPSGWFGPYRGIAARDDLDFVLHVGDYIYEYGNDAHESPAGLEGRRRVQPDSEITVLADYRLRHALYKADRDLQAAHRQHPFITIFDDHEVANNTWRDGAQNHTPGVEGDFHRRRAQALQAYLEWMPIRLPSQKYPHQGIRFFRRFVFGDLADLSVIETRQNRSRQIGVVGFHEHGGYIPAGRRAVDRRLADPSRHLPEPQQMHWLKRSTSQVRDWHLVGNQTIFTPVRFPGSAVGRADVAEILNSDQWDGYQADQQSLIAHLAAQPATHGDAVFLTGDVHSSWAMDIPTRRVERYRSAGVEFVCPSVTSDGWYEGFRKGSKGQDPSVPISAFVHHTRTTTTAIARHNPWVKYLDGIGHGYVVVDVTPERVQGDWYLTPVPTQQVPDPRVVHSIVPSRHAGFVTERGTRRVTPASSALGARVDEPRG